MPLLCARSRASSSTSCRPAGIHAVGRLVEDQQLRIVNDGRRQLEPLLHAGRIGFDLAIAGLAEPDVVEHFVGPLQRILRRHADQLAGIGDELDADDVRKQALVFRRKADCRRMSSCRRRKSMPSTSPEPLSTGISPSSVRIIVVLPEPLGPSSPIAPAGTDTERLSSALMLPYVFVTPANWNNTEIIRSQCNGRKGSLQEWHRVLFAISSAPTTAQLNRLVSYSSRQEVLGLMARFLRPE